MSSDYETIQRINSVSREDFKETVFIPLVSIFGFFYLKPNISAATSLNPTNYLATCGIGT